MDYYYIVTDNLSKGITTKALKPGYDQAKNLAYYLDLNATEDEDEYYHPTQVFEDYDDALATFCNEAATQLAYYKAQIGSIEQAKDQVLRVEVL